MDLSFYPHLPPQATSPVPSSVDLAMERPNRITLKMDVSFTDHSHIIGKGGRSIQAVMNETSCHIHFPDSNRTNTFEKSNQVSIAGMAQGVESARCRIRQLLPLTVYFDIPLNYLQPTAFDQTNPVIQAVQRNFSLVVSLKQVKDDLVGFGGGHKTLFGAYNTRPPTAPPMVRLSIRGTRAHVLGLRQGISILLEQLTSGRCTLLTTRASIDTEVAAQHHPFLMGRGSCNIRNIQKATGVLFDFPDNNKDTMQAIPAASSLPLKRSTVTINGPNFDTAFVAWEDMLGFLPLVLIFDLHEHQDIDAAMVTQMMEQWKLSIVIKPKLKSQGKSIMVRGCERDSRLMFEVRVRMLNMDPNDVPVCCDSHFYATSNMSGMPSALNFSLGSLPAPSVTDSGFPSFCSTPISRSRSPSPPVSRFWEEPAEELHTMLERVLKRAFSESPKEREQEREIDPVALQQERPSELMAPLGYPVLGSSPGSNLFADSFFKPNLWQYDPAECSGSLTPMTPLTNEGNSSRNCFFN